MLDEDLESDDSEINLQDLAIDEISELLALAGASVSHAQAAQLAAFVAQAGDIDEALALLGQLVEQRDAAA